MLNCLISFNTSAFRVTAPACHCLSLLPSPADFFRAALPRSIDIPNLFLHLYLFLKTSPYSSSSASSLSIPDVPPSRGRSGGFEEGRMRERACVSAAAGRSIRDEVDGLATAGPSRQKEITGIISE